MALLACESSDFLQHYIYASLIDMYSKKWREKKTLKSLTRLYEQAAIDLNLMHNLEACSKWQRSGLFWIFQSPQRSAALQACVNMAKKRSLKAATKLFCTRARAFVLPLFLVSALANLFAGKQFKYIQKRAALQRRRGTSNLACWVLEKLSTPTTAHTKSVLMNPQCHIIELNSDSKRRLEWSEEISCCFRNYPRLVGKHRKCVFASHAVQPRSIDLW